MKGAANRSIHKSYVSKCLERLLDNLKNDFPKKKGKNPWPTGNNKRRRDQSQVSSRHVQTTFYQ